MRHTSRIVAFTCAFLGFLLLAGQSFATGASIGASAVPNPDWPAACPLRLGLVVDRSSSMADRFDEVREAARNVVDSLRDKPSELSIIGFGTTAEVVMSAVDVSDENARADLKARIGELGPYEDDNGATNWEAALDTAHELRLDVVILVTDGFPNVYGDPVQEGPQAVAAAVTAADRLKSDGTRLAAVGIDLAQGAENNLEQITGPSPGQDYYATDTAGLLRQLYGIVASSCGVAIAALPQPEPPEFPWTRAILGALGGLILIALAAFVLHRRRNSAVAGAPAPARANRTVAGGPRIDHTDLARQLRADRPTPPTTKDRP